MADETKVATITVELEVIHGNDSEDTYMVVRYAGASLTPVDPETTAEIADHLKFEADYGDLDPDGALNEAIQQLHHHFTRGGDRA